LAAPATRRRAAELGIALQKIAGTGPGGVVTPEDLERHVAAAASAGLASHPGVDSVRITGLRRIIAGRMQDAVRTIPHFTYIEECDLTALESLRAQLNAEAPQGASRLTLLPFFMRALVRLRPAFPSINAHYDGEEGVLHVHSSVHVGIATQTAGGLMVPVVRHVETLGLWDCAREVARAAAAARDGTAARADLTGSTITLTSLGPLGGIAATPIINAPEVAIIGPNRLVQRPVVVDGRIEIRTMMNLSSSFDHRIIDGYEAARFIQALKRLLEQPALLFMEAP
ncbi:dihydrolipoamide acetyltransferase family protein, partial [Devosia sp.]|uniref:dihydrolipoamide acetyltransferase family protein n=1 Tax=Devosia sp. TaxID=1871048 RepID=UPI002EDF58F6